ncbi:hypothetical protein GCM10025785_01530 [Corynebacterium canis]
MGRGAPGFGLTEKCGRAPMGQVGEQVAVLGWCSEDSALKFGARIRRKDSARRIRREDSAVRIRVGFWRVCVGFGAVDGAAQGGDQFAGFLQ